MEASSSCQGPPAISSTARSRAHAPYRRRSDSHQHEGGVLEESIRPRKSCATAVPCFCCLRSSPVPSGTRFHMLANARAHPNARARARKLLARPRARLWCRTLRDRFSCTVAGGL
eukprot:5343195-Alexandrium_andersonii.AAC.1